MTLLADPKSIEHLTSLPLGKKVGQLFFIGISGPEIDAATRDLLTEIEPGGVCLFARNIKGCLQTRELLDGIRSVLSVHPFLSVDQEGGIVDRLRRIMTPMPGASKLRTADDAAQQAELIGDTLSILGFNMNFAPVVDVIDGERGRYSNGLFSRSYGVGHAETVEMAGRFLSCLQSKGIVGCLKHFPGLGASQVDSHEELPVVDIAGDELENIDLFPYRELFKSTNVYAVMLAHAAYSMHRHQQLDFDGKPLPASISYNFISGLLRGELGFDGLVVTDDLEMGAIVKNYGIGAASKMAVLAGVDMLAICADAQSIREGFTAVLRAVADGEIEIGRIDRSLARIAAVKNALGRPRVFDQAHLDRIAIDTAAFAAQLTQ